MSESKNSIIMRFIGKHRVLFGCLLLVWLIGMIFTLNLMGRSNHVKLQFHHSSQPMLHPLQHNRLPPPYSFKMVKANRYCNPPNDISYNQEGRAPANYSLVFVATVVRHGDRSPLRPIRNQSVINCGAQVMHPLLKKYLSVLKHVPRHGKKMYPFSTFTLHPSEKHCSSSQMTITGVQQHLQLGRQLAKVYNYRYRLLNRNWTTDDIKVYSTVYSRTFQSAVAFLFGFLPEFNFAKLKFIPSSDTRFCLSSEYCNCPALDHLQKVMDAKVHQLIESHPAVVRLVQRLNPIVKFHPNHSDITSPLAMFDSLMGYVCHGSHLPCMPGSHNCVTIDHVRNIMAFLEWEGRQFVDDSSSRKQSRLKMQGFLMNLLHHMQRALGSPNAERFVLYSGHDVTLSPLASLLGYDDGMIPPYASRLIFEIYSNQNIGGKWKYIIKVLYNGKDVTKYTPFCKKLLRNSSSKSSSYKSYICPFENFIHFVQEDFLQSLNSSSFKSACRFLPANVESQRATYDPFKDVTEE